MNNQRPYDVLVVGELNVDIILDEIPEVPQIGKERLADKMTVTLGSSSAIFAANISSLGSRTAFCGLLGEDHFGKFVLATLQAKAIDTGLVQFEDTLQTGVTVAFNYGEDRMMVSHPGVMNELTMDDIPVRDFHNFRHLHVSNVFMQPGLKPQINTLFKEARRAGMTTSMDPQWDPEEKWDLNLDQILPELSFFLPNNNELEKLTNTGSTEQALDKLAGSGCVIVIKKGSYGALMQTNSGRMEEPVLQMPVFVDAIGAGDSFNAGFIHAFLKGYSLKQCLKFGNLTGAVSTTGAGGIRAIKSYKQIIETGKELGVFFA